MGPLTSYSQVKNEWDNLFFVGNKVGLGKDKFRATGELQFRVKDNLNQLDRWFIEFTGSFLATKHWEFTLPLRFSIRQGENEFRPGLGFLYKMYPTKKIQIAHQILYQEDITASEAQGGLRYVLFYNHKVNDHLIPNAAAGIFYRWSDAFTGVQFVRFGAGLTTIIDGQHTVNFSYFLGISDSGQNLIYQGIPFIQLVINLGSEYEHKPAQYINF